MVQELDLLGHRLKMASLMPEFRFLFYIRILRNTTKHSKVD